MPTFTEDLLERFGRGELTRDNVVVMHPEDFRSLRMFLDLEGESAHFRSLDSPTIQGARVVSDENHPRGSVTVLDAWRPSLISTYRESFPTLVQPPPSPPEPRSLWERLDEDE